ncbi:nuclear transport factor 2 family protein [Streptomyces mutabilis]|uniref:nuclear transport factor 2 family protein n=1 Tax=Streptomyces mutabilis TaxID=67332 RepID=UPI0022BA1DF9|nr:nuclear transport factor 2 family protein [Streptomyces mutabilis]MCZ9348898.1 nuclear transport factor 2 family protein [Streptomyces mutabilis]
MEPSMIVQEFWDRMQARDWAGLGALLAEDVVVEWPVSAERIVGRENFVRVNAEYPEGWSIHVMRVVADGDTVVSEVEVPHGAMGVPPGRVAVDGAGREDRRRPGVLDAAGRGSLTAVAGRLRAAVVSRSCPGTTGDGRCGERPRFRRPGRVHTTGSTGSTGSRRSGSSGR